MLRARLALLACALSGCASSTHPKLKWPDPIPLPPPGPPQLTGRSPKVLLEDEVSELRKLVEGLRPIDHDYPATLERFAIALLELADSHRDAAISLDPAVRALPPPLDLAPEARPAPKYDDVDEPVGESAWLELTPDAELRQVTAPPPREAISLGQIRPEARARLRIADALSAEALGWLRKLADSPRARERPLDRVLFELASLQEDLGQLRGARATYQRLIKDFPKSEYLPYAWLSFGHRFSEALELDAAATCFEKVLALSRGKVAAIAAHQLALVRHEQKRPDDAWAALAQAALLAREKSPALLEAICDDAKRLRPGTALEGCAR